MGRLRVGRGQREPDDEAGDDRGFGVAHLAQISRSLDPERRQEGNASDAQARVDLRREEALCSGVTL